MNENRGTDDEAQEARELALLARVKRRLDQSTFERVERGIYFGKLIWGIVVAVTGLFVAVVGLAYNAGKTSEKLQTAINAHDSYITELKHAEVRNRMKTVERYIESKDPAFQKWVPEHNR